MEENILFITASSNWPLTDGKRQRTWFLIEGLSKKYNVDVLLIGSQNDKDNFNLHASSVNKLYFINNSHISLTKVNLPSYLLSKNQNVQKKTFLKNLNNYFYDLYFENKYVFLFSRYLQPLTLLNVSKEIKTVCDLDDVYFETQESKILNETNFKQKLKLKFLFYIGAKKVKKIINRIDIPIIVKESDSSFYGLKNAVCLPNLPFGFFINREKIAEIDFISTPPNILSFGFIGKLSYKPNYKGLINFINSVWNPLIENKFEARFVIAGSGELPEVLQQVITESKNIDLLGFVETPDFFWDKVSILVVPVTEGGGSNIKIAEAFIHGKNVIACPFASRGYDSFIDSGHLIMPKNDANWITTMNSILLLNSEQRRLLSEKAKNHFDLDLWNQKLLRIVS